MNAIPDYSAPLAGVPREVDKLTSALADRNLSAAREIVSDLEMRLASVAGWIEHSDTETGMCFNCEERLPAGCGGTFAAETGCRLHRSGVAKGRYPFVTDSDVED